jgi:hypothetical protein
LWTKFFKQNNTELFSFYQISHFPEMRVADAVNQQKMLGSVEITVLASEFDNPPGNFCADVRQFIQLLR